MRQTALWLAPARLLVSGASQQVGQLPPSLPRPRGLADEEETKVPLGLVQHQKPFNSRNGVGVLLFYECLFYKIHTLFFKSVFIWGK